MAKTSYQLIPPEFDLMYSKALTSGDRFTVPRVRRKVLFMSRRRKKGLTEKSLIPTLSLAWQNFSSGERDAWTSAGAVSNLTGFKLFLKDTALRIRNELVGFSTPSDIFQALVGRIHVEAPASSARILQLHPHDYFIQRKVHGTRNQYEAVSVVEDFALPLEIQISYKADLESYGGSGSARFYCVVYSHYQGRTIENVVEIPFNFSQDWQTASASISGVLGLERGYTAFIEILNARGDLYFDNVNILHSGQNWARDPFCQDINQGFTKAFFQIPKHWASDDIGEGAFFDSWYYNN